MITLWVKSCSTPHPRRTHRWRIGDNQTICGLPARQMSPVSTAWTRPRGWYVYGVIKKPCHQCFKYHYRLLSMRRISA